MPGMARFRWVKEACGQLPTGAVKRRLMTAITERAAKELCMLGRGAEYVTGAMGRRGLTAFSWFCSLSFDMEKG